MNDNRSEMYSINSGYYDLPVKEPWVCGKTLYSVITISSAVLVGVAAACFFAPWLFGNTTLTATGITLIVLTMQYLRYLLRSSCFALAFMGVQSSIGNFLTSVRIIVSMPQTSFMQFKRYA